VKGPAGFALHRLAAADVLEHFSIQTISLVLLNRMVMQGAGGAGALLSISTALQLPSLVAVPLAGPFLDRWSEGRVLPLISLARGLAATMLAVWWSDSVVALFLLGVLTFLGAVSHVARNSLLPAITREGSLYRANGLLLRCTIGAGILGPMAAGSLADGFGTGTCIAGAGLLYLFSAVFLLHLPRRLGPGERSAWMHEFVEGLNTVRNDMLLRPALGTLVLWSLGGGMINFAVPLLFKARGVTVDVYGAGLSVFAGGQIAATFLVRLSGKELRRGLPSPLIFAAQGLGMIGLLAAASHPLWICLAFLVMGMASGSAQICLDAFFQKNAHPGRRGRVIAFAVSSRGGCFFLAALIGSLLSKTGFAPLVVVACLVTAAAGRPARRLSVTPGKGVPEIDAKIQIPARPRTSEPDWGKQG
jgi:MFS family permease